MKQVFIFWGEFFLIWLVAWMFIAVNFEGIDGGWMRHTLTLGSWSYPQFGILCFLFNNVGLCTSFQVPFCFRREVTILTSPFQRIYTSTSFSASFLAWFLFLSSPLEILHKVKFGCLALHSSNHLIILYGLKTFSFQHYTLGWAFKIQYLLLSLIPLCGQPFNSIGYTLFFRSHGKEHKVIHNIVKDVFAFIVRIVRFHVLYE
jgi:hypothetical protein